MLSARLRRSWAAGLVLAAAGVPVGAQELWPGRPPAAPPGSAAPTAAAPGARAHDPVPPPFDPGAHVPCGCPLDGFGHTRHRAYCKRHWQEAFVGYPEEFCEWPLGWALYAHGRTMVANGEAAGLV